MNHRYPTTSIDMQNYVVGKLPPLTESVGMDNVYAKGIELLMVKILIYRPGRNSVCNFNISTVIFSFCPSDAELRLACNYLADRGYLSQVSGQLSFNWMPRSSHDTIRINFEKANFCDSCYSSCLQSNLPIYQACTCLYVS